MNYRFYIAQRYLRSKRRTGFISLITYISTVGITIGVAALIITMSVMNGFETEVRNRIIGADAHIRLTMFHEIPMNGWQSVMDSLKDIPHIIGISPFIQGKGMLKFNNQIEGSIIKGIDLKTVASVSDLPKTIVAGDLNLDNLKVEKSPDENIDTPPPTFAYTGIVLGRQLSFRLGAALGDTVILFSPAGMTSFLSTPILKRFIVKGIFETGIYEYDDAFVYISLNDAQQLFELKNQVTGIEIKLNKFERAESVARLIEEKLHYPFYPRTWTDMHRTLFRWMKIEKWLYTILLSLIILVAAFNIISSQIMMVLEKRREIGILKAIGATRKDIAKIFMYEGLTIGIFGTIGGVIIGGALCWAQQTYKFFSLPGDVYFLNSLPIRMQVLDFIVIGIVAMGLTLLATVYPAHRAGKLDPVEAIRYE